MRAKKICANIPIPQMILLSTRLGITPKTGQSLNKKKSAGGQREGDGGGGGGGRKPPLAGGL